MDTSKGCKVILDIDDKYISLILAAIVRIP